MGENDFMRNEMETALKETFRELTLKTRYKRGFTQSKMSRALVMSERSYEDIERGKTGCGVLTAVLLLMEIDNPIDFINNLKVQLERVRQGTVACLDNSKIK